MHTAVALALVVLGAAPPVGELSADGLDVLGWTADGLKVAVVTHGVYDGKGTPWAKAMLYDTKKNSIIGAPVAVELETEGATEAQAVAEACKQLKAPALVAGKKIKVGENGALTAADGSPIGNVVVKAKKGSKGKCSEPFTSEVLTVQLALMGDDGPVTVLKEKKAPATRACSSSCVPVAAYGQAKGGLFVLRCQVPGFEGAASAPFPVTTGTLEFPLEADLP